MKKQVIKIKKTRQQTAFTFQVLRVLFMHDTLVVKQHGIVFAVILLVCEVKLLHTPFYPSSAKYARKREKSTF